MEAVLKDHWYFLVLLWLLSSLKVTVQQKDAVQTVRLEEGMVLECLCPWEGNLSMVSWTKIPESSPAAVFHPDYGVALSYRYRERIEFLRTSPMDGSISVRNVTHRDEGLYRCSVQTFPQGSWSTDLLVQDSAELDFLPPTEEAPEVTEADTKLEAERSDNLTIRCSHAHNGTVYQVTVEKLAPGDGAVVMGTCRLADGGPVAEDGAARGRVDCSDTLEVSLRLVDVVEEDGGVYRCRFSTDAGVHTTTVLLTVPGPGTINLSDYMMYLYIATGLAGLVLLAVIIIVVARHRKHNKRTEYRVKLQPSRRQPNYYENIPVYDQMVKIPRQMKDGPLYANIQTTRQQKHTLR